MSALPVSQTDNKPSRPAAPSTGQPTAPQMPKKTLPKPSAPILTTANQNAQKKVPRRSSKPIINWFQRLAGSGKAKRTENLPLRIADLGVARNGSNPGRPMGRITSSPLPVPVSYHLKQQSRPDAASLARRKTRSISLHGDEELRDLNEYLDDDASLDQSSLNRESIWSPASALEADDDASVRPIPPSSPPSPSPSRSSSSYLSDPRTFRSMAASTKPTTLLSIDLNGNGMAHIAQAPTPPAHLSRFVPHVRQSSSLGSAGLLSSAGSITFSTLPTAQPSSRPTSLRNPGSLGSISMNTQQTSIAPMSSVQAPLHTTHHPRNNPRPSSPPLDNASVLTLASSAFGLPNRIGTQNYSPSAIGDSVSYGGSIIFPDAESASHYVPGDDDRLEERDFDASVRALRPRSSRRGSWESEASRWSARFQTGTPSLARERSLWTSNSLRTGVFNTENGDTETDIYDIVDDQTEGDITGEVEEFTQVESPLETPFDGVKNMVEELTPPPAPKEFVSGVKKSEQSNLSSDGQKKVGIPPIVSIPRASTDTIAQRATSPNIGSTPQQAVEQIQESEKDTRGVFEASDHFPKPDITENSA